MFYQINSDLTKYINGAGSITTNTDGSFAATNPNFVGKNVKFIAVTRCASDSTFFPCLILAFDTSNGYMVGQVLNRTTAITVDISYVIAYTD